MTLSSFSFLYFCLEQRPRLSNHFCICSLYLSCSVLSLLSANDDEVCIDAWAYLVGDGGFGVKSNFSKKKLSTLGNSVFLLPPSGLLRPLMTSCHWIQRWPFSSHSPDHSAVLDPTDACLPREPSRTPCSLGLPPLSLAEASYSLQHLFFFSSLLLNIKVSQGLLLGLLFFLFLLYILSQESHWWAWLPLPPHQGWLPVHSLV